MELILTMVEQGLAQTIGLKDGVRKRLIENYDVRELFPEAYQEKHKRWANRSGGWQKTMVDDGMISRSQELPFSKFYPGFWIPRESKLLIKANDVGDNVPEEVYAKGNILPLGFYLARNAFNLFRKIDSNEFGSEGLNYDQIWEKVLDHRNLSHIICIGDDQQVPENIFELSLQDFPRMSREEFDESYQRLIKNEYVFKKGSRYLFNGGSK